MTRKKEEKQADELSQLIDAMHHHETVHSLDEETKELARFAAAVKQRLGNERPPAELVNQTVDIVLAEKGKRGHGMRRWLQMAAAGAAAAAFLLVAQMNPATLPGQTEDKQLAQGPSVPSVIEKQAPLVPPMVVTPLPETAAIPSAPPVTPQAPEKSQPLPDTTAERLPAARESGVAAAKTEQADKPERAAKQNEQKVAALLLPGRKADVTVEEQGSWRQVYSAGTKDEIVITQKEQPAQYSMAMRKAAAPVENRSSDSENPEALAEGVNKVTMAVGSRQVTVEGRKPEAELRQIAQSLSEEGKAEDSKTKKEESKNKAEDKKPEKTQD